VRCCWRAPLDLRASGHIEFCPFSQQSVNEGGRPKVPVWLTGRLAVHCAELHLGDRQSGSKRHLFSACTKSASTPWSWRTYGCNHLAGLPPQILGCFVNRRYVTTIPVTTRPAAARTPNSGPRPHLPPVEYRRLAFLL
jgi:hypothetical protein